MPKLAPAKDVKDPQTDLRNAIAIGTRVDLRGSVQTGTFWNLKALKTENLTVTNQ